MQKKNINIGFRGWMLVLYQAIAFLTFTAFTNYPLNILADFYGGAQIISMLLTGGTLLGIVIQLTLSRFIGRIPNVKVFGTILGAVSLVLALGIMYIPFASALLWRICYFFECMLVTLYATFAVSVLVGQWFPRRKGTIMGIATFAFPIANALIGAFAGMVFANMATTHVPNISGAFMPFFIVSVIGLLIGAIFIKDYPEQVGAYRDNDKSITPEIGRAMMEQEIINKKSSVWTLGNTLKSRDFWFIAIPMGFLLMCSVGLMTQTNAIINTYEAELAGIGLNYGLIMLGICVVGCFGSWLIGVLDTRFGTKYAVMLSVSLMVIGGLIGFIANMTCLLVSLFFLAIFMGASSNFTVSVAAQYWRREDFSSVFSCTNPIPNFLQAIGPMIIAILVATQGYNYAFLLVGILGVVSVVLTLLFSPAHIKETDDKYRKAAGKPLDDALVGRR